MDASTDINPAGLFSLNHGMPVPGQNGKAAGLANQFFAPAMTLCGPGDLVQRGPDLDGFAEITTVIFTKFLHAQKVHAKARRCKYILQIQAAIGSGAAVLVSQPQGS